MQTWQFLYFLFNKYISNLKTGRFETRRFETWRFVNLTFCKPYVLKPDVLKPDILKPDVLKPDILKPDVLWVYQQDDIHTLFTCIFCSPVLLSFPVRFLNLCLSFYLIMLYWGAPRKRPSQRVKRSWLQDANNRHVPVTFYRLTGQLQIKRKHRPYTRNFAPPPRMVTV